MVRHYSDWEPYTESMKRWLSLPLLALAAVGCGVPAGPAVTTPAVSTGNLLLAPAQVPIGGVKVRAEAAPVVTACSDTECNNFWVPVRLYASSGTLPALKVTGVYVVTEGGVWRSGVQARDNRRCNDLRCLVATARGSADLSGGEAVQVVVALKDAQGRQYRLRDQKAVVQAQ